MNCTNLVHLEPMSKQANQILDTLNASVFLLDKKRCIRYANATAEALFETSALNLSNRDFDSLFSALEPSTILEKIHQQTELTSGLTEREANITFASGKTIVADYSISLLAENDQDKTLLIEIRPLEHQIQLAQQEHNQLQNLAGQQLARGLAHEIKNPLSGIRGAAQLLEKQLANPDLAEYTEVIIAEVDRLDTLINKLLGPVELEQMQPVNILQVLEYIRKIILAAEPERIQIRRDYDPSIPELYADSSLLIQAFLNIARNAVQAIDGEGEITFKTRIDRRITIGRITHPLVIQIDISDNGRGVSEALSETIFLPMITDKAEGSGLGLPITQEIISRHGGTIRMQSNRYGTTFSTVIPIKL
ncbi:MAG: two-component system nitrogen regulation sensor histidine kinase GlnL [Gammaproteobacteria bacterium]|jgi:two-component system nitrogen regulation sensor histidine kinase GlnL